MGMGEQPDKRRAGTWVLAIQPVAEPIEYSFTTRHEVTRMRRDIRRDMRRDMRRDLTRLGGEVRRRGVGMRHWRAGGGGGVEVPHDLPSGDCHQIVIR